MPDNANKLAPQLTNLLFMAKEMGTIHKRLEALEESMAKIEKTQRDLAQVLLNLQKTYQRSHSIDHGQCQSDVDDD